MFLVADASQREELAKQFLTRLPLTEDHAEWRVVLNAIELLIQQGNQEVNNSFRHQEFADQQRSIRSLDPCEISARPRTNKILDLRSVHS